MFHSILDDKLILVESLVGEILAIYKSELRSEAFRPFKGTVKDLKETTDLLTYLGEL